MAEPHSENREGKAQGDQALYGLLHEPFGAETTSTAFFPGATREQRLNLLLHLVPLGEALLITGISGVGKRTLADQFVLRAQESWRFCRIDAATSGLDSNTLLQQLARCFAPDATSLSDRQESERMVVGQLQGLRKSAQQPILLIENGEKISESGFRALSKFIAHEADEEKLLGVVLFGLPGIEEKLSNPALQTLRAQIKHTFELPQLSEEETAAYLDHRMRAAGLQGDSPYTAAVNRAIYGASNGLPRRINELAQAVLQNKCQAAESQAPQTQASDTSDTNQSKLKKYLTPRNSWPFAVAALLGSVLLFQEQINALFEPSPEAVPPASQKPPSQESLQGDVVRDAKGFAIDEDFQQEKASPLSDSTEERVTEAVESPIVAIDEQQESAPGKKDREEQPPEVGLPVAELARAPQFSEPEVENLPTEVVPDDMVVGVEDEEQVSPPVAEVDGDRGRWVLTQSPDEYTLQLVAQEVPEKREKFLQRFGLEEAVERFSTSKKGRRWYVAAYGIYPSRTAALEGSRQLPEGVVPWVRSFGSIQKELWQTEVAPSASGSAVTLSRSPAERVELTEQERWVMARSPDHFVLQLAAFEQPARTREFIKRHALEEVAKEVRLVNHGKVWHVAVYGDATNRAEARLLSESLNKNNKLNNIWVRTFDSLQGAMREFQQN